MAAPIALVAFWVTGCTVGPRYHPPAPPTVSTYTPAPPEKTVNTNGPSGTSQHFDASAQLPAQWWELFHSPQLNAMVSEALANSPSLAQATARLSQAQEELRARSGATRFPTVTGSASVEQKQVNLAAFGVPFPNPSPFTLLNGSVAISYALDIFGGNRRQIEALRAQIDYQQWQLEGARLMLAGNVVSAAIRQAKLQQQIEITRQLLAAERQQTAIIEQRRAAGGATELEIHRQQTVVAQTQATIPALQQQLDAVNDQLAVLMGKSPAEAQVQSISLDSLQLPQDLPVSLPSSLARQRPDIRAAEALLHRASAEVGVATANLYPQIVLSGNGGSVGTSFTSGGDIWNVGAGLTQPIFNGGALRAEKRKAIAAYDEAGSAYKQTFLTAFQQVADTLYAIQHDAEALQASDQAASEAAAAYSIASDRYRAGGISQLALLDAERQQLQTALDRTASAASRYADSATLFEALGGGWWNQPSNSAPSVQAENAP
ncbi:MAG TPA: efflux transporter outer membrane subunit [Terracidiphilus sp.]|nr:efflux transporter outer membrane subunit [Terracidiphilus sp.]